MTDVYQMITDRILTAILAAIPSRNACYVYSADGSYYGEYINVYAAQAAIYGMCPALRVGAEICDADGNQLQA